MKPLLKAHTQVSTDPKKITEFQTFSQRNLKKNQDAGADNRKNSTALGKSLNSMPLIDIRLYSKHFSRGKLF